MSCTLLRATYNGGISAPEAWSFRVHNREHQAKKKPVLRRATGLIKSFLYSLQRSQLSPSSNQGRTAHQEWRR